MKSLDSFSRDLAQSLSPFQIQYLLWILPLSLWNVSNSHYLWGWKFVSPSPPTYSRCTLSVCFVPSWSCWHKYWSPPGLQRPLCLFYKNWVPPGDRDHRSREPKGWICTSPGSPSCTCLEIISAPSSGPLLPWQAADQDFEGLSPSNSYPGFYALLFSLDKGQDLEPFRQCLVS